MKITTCEMRKVLGKIKERLKVIKEKNGEFEDIVKEISKLKHSKKKN